MGCLKNLISFLRLRIGAELKASLLLQSAQNRSGIRQRVSLHIAGDTRTLVCDHSEVSNGAGEGFSCRR
jgi:hypothetical protein